MRRPKKKNVDAQREKTLTPTRAIDALIGNEKHGEKRTNNKKNGADL